MSRTQNRFKMLEEANKKIHDQFINFLRNTFKNDDDSIFALRLSFWDYFTYETYARCFCKEADYDYNRFLHLA